VYLTNLTLLNFRTYRNLELDLPPGLVVLHGDNGQGKSNLLEAVYMLAITKSPRTETERSVISFAALEEAPYTRLTGAVRLENDSTTQIQIDMAILGKGNPEMEQGGSTFQKRIRVNGVPRPAFQALGTLIAVLFSAGDINLVSGPPSGRRRFLDVLLSQVDPDYLYCLQRYQQVVTQRNHLLRAIAEGRASTDELSFWDGRLCTEGAFIVSRRREVVEFLSLATTPTYASLSDHQERLVIQYAPSIDCEGPRENVASWMQERLKELRHRELKAGHSLAGPHRDDLRLLVNGIDLGVYGSRGQARTLALALRLAEARFLASSRHEEPVLLLDDAFSELDSRRRAQVMEAASQTKQTLLTTVDIGQYAGARFQKAPRFHVREGTVTGTEKPITPISSNEDPSETCCPSASKPDLGQH
jgi:DNA replication and repair protein RecF